MDTGAGARRQIVVGVDGSERSLEAVDWAAAEATERGMALRICHVTRSEEQAQRDHARRVLSVATERAHQVAPDLPVTDSVLSGHPAKALLTDASGAEALVLGSRGGGGFASLLLGAVSEQAAAHGEGPVLVVRGRRRVGPIVVGVDGSPESQAALGFGFARAAELGVPVRAVHAYTLSMAVPSFGYIPDTGVEQIMDAAKETLEQALAAWREKYPNVSVTSRVVDDLASVALVDETDDCGLLVVGSRGHGGFAGLLLGSVSRHVLRHARCPVAVVRS